MSEVGMMVIARWKRWSSSLWQLMIQGWLLDNLCLQKWVSFFKLTSITFVSLSVCYIWKITVVIIKTVALETNNQFIVMIIEYWDKTMSNYRFIYHIIKL